MEIKGIYVEWVDAKQSSSGWRSFEDVEEFINEPCIVKQIGFIYRQTNDKLVLIDSIVGIEGDLDYGSVHVIPAPWIVKIVELPISIEI